MARRIDTQKWLPKKGKNKGGRPTKLLPEVVQKLKESFAIDASVEEACYYAEISVQTYYNWIKEDPKLFEEFERLRQKPVLAARMEVVKGIAGDKHFSFGYLRSKRPQEFGDKLKLEHSGSVSLDPAALNTPEMLAIKDRYERELYEATARAHDAKPKELDKKEEK
jgi:hypothetical protein